ncbi:glycosyltransferase [Photobacterium damselae subsp. damselae]|uniref:glycosyltransferase family 2 protein n=1 Tax=Photobacterium damselae TaxID=38293 RepID=UPI000A2F993D|nr:glycosyltransferase family 2 protein [Photobacterium damselae]ARR49877.1 hypothetical protein CAY62_10040 [Photobacterium damselae subsp. damselae]QAY35578.1 glycosyltransferase [Photobacterium damselae subsp. damselae]
MRKKLTVITVVYNCEDFIQSCIESVISQKDIDLIEYIIIDGGSTDGTLDIISRYKNNINVLVSEPDNGIYDAMNKGLKIASGEFVCFLNADDIYIENVLSDVIDCISETKNVDVITAKVNMVNRATLCIEEKRKSSVHKLFIGMTLNHPATFFKTKLHRKYLYNTDYKIAADYDVLLRMKKDKVNFRKLDKVIVNMRNGGVSDAYEQKGESEAKKIRKINNSNSLNFFANFYSLVRKTLGK